MTHRRTTAGTRLVAVAVAIALAACGLEDGSHLDLADPPRSTTTTAPVMTPRPDDPAGLPTYTTNECPLTAPRRIDVTCGTLTVSRDREHPDEGTIAIAVARMHARSDVPAADPIVYFEGGPGGASVTYLDWWADHDLLEDRDIILFDQRGTGYSEPNLACDEEFVEADESDDDISLYQDCYERLAEDTDLADFTTLEAAADVAGLLEAMELTDVNLLGISYGTRLAMVVQTLYPERVRSVVLDSVYPPGVEAFEQLAPNGARSFDALFAACTEDPACDEAYPDLESTLYATVDLLDAEPVEVELTNDYTGELETSEALGSDLVDALFSALYDNTLIPDVPAAITQASSGDPDDVEAALRTLYGEYYYETSGASGTADEPPDDSDGLYYSVTCSEEIPITQMREVREAASEIDAEVRDELVAGAEYDVSVCKVWDAGQRDNTGLSPVDSDLPTLLLGGRFDPITPPRWAFESAERLPNAYAYEFEGIGHGVMDSDPCPMSVVQAFLDDPKVEPDASCATEIEPPDFEVD